MIGRLAASFVLSTLSLIQTADVPHQMPRTVAELGDDLTLKCPATGDKVGLFFWYKMKFGYMVQTVAGGAIHKQISLEGQFNNSRFSIAKVDVLYHLDIKNVSKEDEGAYFCQSGAAYLMTFKSGTVLAINDLKKQQVKETTVETKQDPVVVIILGVLLGLSVVVIGILIFTRD